MYPNLYYFFLKTFGWELPYLKIFNTFGVFVALAFILGTYFLTKDIKRREKNNLLAFENEEITIGEAPNPWLVFGQFCLGFFIGFKILNLILYSSKIDNPEKFLFSAEGSLPLGIILGGLLSYIYYKSIKQKQLPTPEKRTIRIWPSDRITDIVFLAFLWGIIGAKLFFYIEIWDDFWKSPKEYILSLGGLTFYGGLITAFIFIFIYLKKHKIDAIQFLDTGVVILLLSYGVGRLGCHFSGDGDWGIVNSNPNPWKFLPDWLWSYNYPNNVVNDGIPIPGCTYAHNRILPQNVYPTSLYEAIIMILAFIVLWNLRTKLNKPLLLTGIYCIINGSERFFIEKIRVNYKYDWGFMHPTQAEVISSIFIIVGLGILAKIYLFKPKII